MCVFFQPNELSASLSELTYLITSERSLVYSRCFLPHRSSLALGMSRMFLVMIPSYLSLLHHYRNLGRECSWQVSKCDGEDSWSGKTWNMFTASWSNHTGDISWLTSSEVTIWLWSKFYNDFLLIIVTGSCNCVYFLRLWATNWKPRWVTICKHRYSNASVFFVEFTFSSS